MNKKKKFFFLEETMNEELYLNNIIETFSFVFDPIEFIYNS